MALTKDQVRLKELLLSAYLKFITGLVVAVAFLGIIAYIILGGGWKEKLVAGMVNSVLGNTIYQIIDHYFLVPKTEPKVSWPQKHWWLIMIFAILVGGLSVILWQHLSFR